jgi:polysaccharide chain length determinant protein (PEP-CTERM system associated)
MDELVHRALTIVRGMWHRRWIGLATAWIVAIVGVSIALRIPDRYEATARVYVDTQNLLRPLMEGLSIQPNLDQQVALISRTLISRPNIEKLVRMADLDIGIENQSAAARDDLIDMLMRSVQLSGNASTNVYQISYRNTSPEQARRVVQSLLTIFVEQSLGDKRQDSRVAVKFVDEQIKQYEESLKAAEGRLKNFRLKYLGVAGQAGPDYFAKMGRLSDEIEAARLELRAAEQSRDSYKREVAGETPVLLTELAPPAPVALPVLDTRLASLHNDLDALQRRFTEAHPDIVSLKKSIADLESQRKQEFAAYAKASRTPGRGGGDLDRNPVFQSLKVSLAEAESHVAALRARLSSYEGQYAQLKSSAQLVPQVDAEFAQLNRDYEIQKRTYESLLARRQSATLGEGVQDAGGTQFRVIDPPRVLPTPVPPTRFSLLAFAIVAALAAGVAAAFAIAELKPTFHDARSLGIATKRPAVGMLSMLPNEQVASKRRRSMFLFAGGLSGLIASCLGILAFAILVARAA